MLLHRLREFFVCSSSSIYGTVVVYVYMVVVVVVIVQQVCLLLGNNSPPLSLVVCQMEPGLFPFMGANYVVDDIVLLLDKTVPDVVLSVGWLCEGDAAGVLFYMVFCC